MTRLLSGDGTAQVAEIILFPVLGLIIGSFMRELHKTKLKIPYTPILLVVGLIGGAFWDHFGTIGRSSLHLSDIDPHGILLIFVPILVFESAFNADFHIFKRALYQILLLAGPGIGISFLLVAVVMKVILGYDDDEMSWEAALVLGTMVSATDPVAVVALLKELGAPHSFSTIIEGESLLNDGTAIVFFSIFLKLAEG